LKTGAGDVAHWWTAYLALERPWVQSPALQNFKKKRKRSIYNTGRHIRDMTIDLLNETI
jgi:hypothetical protein